MKAIKTISFFLGISMFMFGILKFIHPFKGWYTVQVFNSDLGELSYWLGITGEILVGLTLIGSLAYRKKMSYPSYRLAVGISSAAVIIMMTVGVYVHLHPNVPADVLPLKIKPPYIPIFFLLLALINVILSRKQINRQAT